MTRETSPEITRINGRIVIEEDDGRFGVWGDDEREAGPFPTRIEAMDAARALQSKNSPRR